eukprot:1197926-Rhodomonas_salina.1
MSGTDLAYRAMFHPLCPSTLPTAYLVLTYDSVLRAPYAMPDTDVAYLHNPAGRRARLSADRRAAVQVRGALAREGAPHGGRRAVPQGESRPNVLLVRPNVLLVRPNVLVVKPSVLLVVANRHPDAAKLLAEIAQQLVKTKSDPRRARKLFVLAALE